MLSKCLGFRGATRQELYQPFHHPRGIALSGMHPRTDEDSLFGQGFGAFWIFILARNRKILATIACKSPRQRAPMVKVLCSNVFFNPG